MMDAQNEATDQPDLPAPVARRVIRCAHRAGNEVHLLQHALSAGVDWIEVDIWYAHGRLHARHERALWRLPILYDRWRVRVRPRLLPLAELLRIVGTRAGVLIDLKGLHPRLPAAIVRTVHEANAIERVAVCGQNWALLDEIGRLDPRIPLYYSFGNAQHTALYRAGEALSQRAAGVSVARWLLDEETIARFHAGGLRVIAWTVNDVDEAAQLTSWGVDGITSDRFDLLATLP
jgi:glycerophosphoryl diester phosphodiesterase